MEICLGIFQGKSVCCVVLFSCVLVYRDMIPDTELNVEGLLEGMTYIFRVAAENQAGPGQFSIPSDPKTAQAPICT